MFVFKFIYYFFGLFAIMYEWWAIANYDKLERFREKAKVTTDFDKLSDNGKAFSVLQFLYMFWGFVGLFSSQWLCFLLLIILSIINPKIRGKEWNFIDSVLSILLIMFAILNTYHWHISLPDVLVEFFNDNKK